MEQAVAIKEGRLAPARHYVLPMTARRSVVSEAPTFAAYDVIATRRALGFSQRVFAQVLNVSAGTVRSWEQGTRTPDGAARRILEIARGEPALMQRLVREKTSRGVATPRPATPRPATPRPAMPRPAMRARPGRPAKAR
jgi:DNA-binding transcriptional regulator YiaG